MTRHFLYFIGRTARNRLSRQLRRLRTPRYALAALAGLAYFWIIFGGGRFGASDQAALGTTYISAARSIGPLLLAVLAAWWWLWGGHRAGLVLTPAETHLLVPAPIPRPALVRFKIMQAQIPIAFSAAIGVLLTQGSLLAWPARYLSLWSLLATLHMHQIAASLVHAAAEEQGRRGIRRQAVPLALFVVAVVTLLIALTGAAADIRATPGFEFAVQRLGSLVEEPGPRIVLAPFRLVLAPLTATAVGTWIPAFLLALLVLAAHYAWVQRTDAAFEETAAEQGVRRAARVAAVRSGDVARLRLAKRRTRRLARPILPLQSRAPAAWAILWKNVLYAQRTLRPVALIVVLGSAIALLSPTLFTSDSAAQALRRVGIVLLAFAGLATVVGPLVFRVDLRMDLRHIEALRTYPLRGRDIVVAEIAAGALVIAALQLPLTLAGLALLALAGSLSLPVTAAAALLALLVLPAIDALGVTIQNAIALLYPGWARIGEQDSGGMEAVGQNLLTLIGTVLLLAVTSIPPLLTAFAVGAPLMLAAPFIAAPLAALAATAAVAAEVFLLTRWLGRLYDRTDPITAGLLR